MSFDSDSKPDTLTINYSPASNISGSIVASISIKRHLASCKFSSCAILLAIAMQGGETSIPIDLQPEKQKVRSKQKIR